MRFAVRPRILGFWTLLGLLLFAGSARAQYRDEYGDIRQTVARISYIAGSASFSRGDQPDDWQAADLNVPMTLGDRIYTGERGRLELQIHGGDYVRLGARSDLAALNLTDDTKQFSLGAGVASFEIRRLGEEEVFEVDTPEAAITFERPGEYRVDVDPEGNTRVGVRSGGATVAAGGGQVALRAGEEMDVEGIDSPRYDIVALGRPDGWDRFVSEREGRVRGARSYQYVSADVVGVGDLDEYGRWEDIPAYGHCWTPAVVEAGWAPYRVGHWFWQDPWGWTWISGEPWGWAPYHYGRWVVYSSRWYWVPVAASVRYVSYSPALVAFVGGGPGWSASVTFGGGAYVGWFPLGPRDPLVPWWGRRASVNVTNVSYVNRTYVTVVNQTSFVSGSLVARSVVRDPAIVRELVAAPAAREPIPVVPTTASLHVAVRTDLPSPPRPPAQIVARPVVARVAPPPAPPTFQAKLTTIRENRGLPVAPAAAARISVEDRGRPQATTVVRPVAAEPGRVTLSPRQVGASAARPEPVAPTRGRPMATTQQPVASAPVVAPGVPNRERAAPAPPAPVETRSESQRSQPPARVAPREAAPTQPAPERAPVRENEDWRARQRVNPSERPTAAPAPAQPQPVPQARPGEAPQPRARREQVAPPDQQRVAPANQPENTPVRPQRQAAPQPAPVPDRGRAPQNVTPAAPQTAPVPERGRERQNAAPPPRSEERPADRSAPAQGQPRAVDRAAPQAPARDASEKKEQPKEKKKNEKDQKNQKDQKTEEPKKPD